MSHGTFCRYAAILVLACLLSGNALHSYPAGPGLTLDVAQQPDPKKKELTASVLRSAENETLKLDAYFPAESNNIKVALYNILGKLIEVHPSTRATEGRQSFLFLTKGLPSGPYLVVLESNGQRLVNKVMVSR